MNYCIIYIIGFVITFIGLLLYHNHLVNLNQIYATDTEDIIVGSVFWPITWCSIFLYGVFYILKKIKLYFI